VKTIRAWTAWRDGQSKMGTDKVSEESIRWWQRIAYRKPTGPGRHNQPESTELCTTDQALEREDWYAGPVRAPYPTRSPFTSTSSARCPWIMNSLPVSDGRLTRTDLPVLWCMRCCRAGNDNALSNSISIGLFRIQTPVRKQRKTRSKDLCDVWAGRHGVFNCLPFIRTSLLCLPSLRWLLRFCHSNNLTKTRTWQTRSAIQRWAGFFYRPVGQNRHPPVAVNRTGYWKKPAKFKIQTKNSCSTGFYRLADRFDWFTGPVWSITGRFEW